MLLCRIILVPFHCMQVPLPLLNSGNPVKFAVFFSPPHRLPPSNLYMHANNLFTSLCTHLYILKRVDRPYIPLFSGYSVFLPAYSPIEYLPSCNPGNFHFLVWLVFSAGLWSKTW